MEPRLVPIFYAVHEKIQAAIDQDSLFWQSDDKPRKIEDIITPFDAAIDALDKFLEEYSAPIEPFLGERGGIPIEDPRQLLELETTRRGSIHLAELGSALLNVRNWYARLWNSKLADEPMDTKALEAEYEALRETLRSYTTKRVVI